MKLLDLILGRPLTNKAQQGRKIGLFTAVPAMGLDGLGSASYGPEAALTILAPIGAASLTWIGWVTAPILLLLAVLYLSYRQTVVAYQSSGGAYTVSKENLGPRAGLIAAAAIMIDYVLNVAVGISAGVGALTSSVPGLQSHTLALCLAVLALVTLANLRGTAEAGLLFALPTYVFLLSFLGIVGLGVVNMILSAGHPHAVVAPPPMGGAREAVSVWLLVRAFAAGCTAMTGVEAVSNAVGAFRAPVVARAHQTLTLICLALGLLLAGVAATAWGYRLAALDQSQPGYQSILSQLAAAVLGRGPVYDVAMASLLAVLCLSANTSFVGFPRLARLVAEDSCLPRPFAVPDRRLVFSAGVGFLTATAGALLIAFQGITDRLIPLFAVGAFLTFAMSQIGMVAHWRRQPGRNRRRLAINALGAAITVIALVVIVLAKFAEGAWIVVLALPLIYAFMRAVRRYYDRLDASLAPASDVIQPAETAPPTVIVALAERTRMSDQALNFAMTLTPDVMAAHLYSLRGPDEEEDLRAIRQAWEREVAEPLRARGQTPPRLVLLPAPYREIHRPLLELIEKLDADTPGRSVAVLIPELVLNRFWEGPLHVRRARRLRRALLRHGGPRLNLIVSPWRPGAPGGADPSGPSVDPVKNRGHLDQTRDGGVKARAAGQAPRPGGGGPSAPVVGP